MQVQILDEAKDWEETLPVLSLAKEKDGLTIATPTLTILIGPFAALADSIIELVGQDDLPEPQHRNEQNLQSLVDLLGSSR